MHHQLSLLLKNLNLLSKKRKIVINSVTGMDDAVVCQLRVYIVTGGIKFQYHVSADIIRIKIEGSMQVFEKGKG